MSAVVSREPFVIDAERGGAVALRQPAQPEQPALRAPATTRWPVLACAFIATAAATGAFLESPLATHPTVAPYVTAAVSSVTGAFDGVVAMLR